MQYSSYRRFAVQHLNLVPILLRVIEPEMDSAGARDEDHVRQWVEEWLRYVAERPWDDLILGATDRRVVSDSDFEYDMPQFRRHYIFFHTAGEQAPCTMVIPAAQSEREKEQSLSRPIASIIGKLSRRHQQMERKHRRLVLDAVCGVTDFWALAREAGEVDHRLPGRMEVEIFPAPSGFLETYSKSK